MYHASLTLTAWLARATPAQRDELTKLSGSSAAYLYQLATGRRNASADKAADIEAATQLIEGLPPVLRTDSCKACSACPLAAKCTNGSAQAA